jgi:DNA-binding CsgD family transcriptional regulator
MKTTRSFTNIASFFRSQLHPAGKKPSPLAIALIVAGALLFAGILFFLLTILIAGLWAWLVPDLFPQAVKNGSLAGTISWWTAFKILIAILLVGSLLGKNTVRVEKDHEKKQPAAVTAEVVEAEPPAPAIPPATRVFPALVDPLTDRELEALQLLGKGLTNQQIAVQLSVSESTVVYHIGHIFGKLRVSSRVEAAVWAKEHGII